MSDPKSDEDEVWRQIVASFDEPPAVEQTWPDAENVPAKAEEDDTPTLDAPPPPDDPVAAKEVHDEDEGHYVPPPPPPLPKLDAVTKWAWLALFGGPAYLLASVLFRWEIQGWLAFAAVAAFVGGFITLVIRMGDEPPRDSGWDDGAVI